MNADLRAWLLEGDPLPDGTEAQALLDADPQASALLDELVAIEAAAAGLPDLDRPDGLDAFILDAIAIEAAAAGLPDLDRPDGLDAFILDAIAIDAAAADLPELERPDGLDAQVRDAIRDQGNRTRAAELPDAVAADAEVLSTPRPANRRMLLWVGTLTAVAAALLLAFTGLPMDDGRGDPANWTPRGEEAIGPAVDLRIAVQASEGDVDRLHRGRAYEPGDTLLFRYDAHVPGTLHLVRVDLDGVTVVHTQDVGGQGTADLSGDLRTSGGRVGYALETGETEAVFALIRTEDLLDADRLTRALDVGPDVDAVCAEARALGGRCAAELVEAVQ